MKGKKLLIVSHAVILPNGDEIHGSAHLINESFISLGFSTVFVRYALAPYGPTIISTTKEETKLFLEKKFLFLGKFLGEIVFTLLTLYRMRKEKPLFIGVDPLNALSGLIGKRLSIVSTVIFYMPDFTEERFPNKLMNTFYHWIEKICLKNADQVWVPSIRIKNVVLNKKIVEDKIFYVPNMPRRKVIDRIKSVQKKFDIIMISNLTNNVSLFLIIDTLKSLEQKGVLLKALFIVPGKLYKEIDTYVKMHQLGNCTVLPAQPYNKVLELIKSSKVGLALYDGSMANNVYGDSLKIREYICCGLPVISTNVPENAQEISKEKIGLVISLNKRSLENALLKILDTKNYRLYKLNTKRIGRMMDFDRNIKIPLQMISSNIH